MSVGFGFSAGDFIAALNLVGTVIDALRESGRSSSNYRDLIGELYSLESALLRVKRVELDDSQHADAIALRQAASQCQRAIDSFWTETQKYQPHFGLTGSGSKVKDSWMKIQWALCKKKDLAEFQAKLRGHTASIELLLMTVQMDSTNLQGKKQEHQHQTLAGRIQAATFQSMGKVKALQTSLSRRTNTLVFQTVLSLQKIITSLPGQVEGQQPVYFVDALGRHAPFHLEFVRSAEAFKSVLKFNFSKIKNGPKKIDNGEFVIEEAGTGRLVDLTQDWDSCFLPGQTALMSMVFHQKGPGSTCPSCKAACDGPQDKELLCPVCRFAFRRIKEVEETKEDLKPSLVEPNGGLKSLSRRPTQRNGAITPRVQSSWMALRKRKRRVDVDVGELRSFRRVHIRTFESSLAPSWIKDHFRVAASGLSCPPPPPLLLVLSETSLKMLYPWARFSAVMVLRTVADIPAEPMLGESSGPISRPGVSFYYYPRIKCDDCGGIYEPDVDCGLIDFEVHLRNHPYNREVSQPSPCFMVFESYLTLDLAGQLT